MTPNVGNTPPDYNSPTGKFRLLVQDVVATDLVPAVTGQGQYTMFSDDEIAGYLSIYPTSLFRAVGTAYKSLAARAALEAKIVKDFDLQVDLTKKSAALNDAADAFFARANDDDLLSGARSTFDVVAPDNSPSLGELTGLPIEQWAWKEGIDIPAQLGVAPFLWNWQ